ncbi:hypothetical protein ACS26T_27245, partial [Bacillus cereus group sp. BC10]
FLNFVFTNIFNFLILIVKILEFFEDFKFTLFSNKIKSGIRSRRPCRPRPAKVSGRCHIICLTPGADTDADADADAGTINFATPMPF